MKTATFKNQSNRRAVKQAYLNLNDNQKILVDSFSKIFKADPEEFIDIIGLFSKADFHSVRVIECLGRIKKDKIINAVILLEYLLCSGDKSLEIVNENNCAKVEVIK